MRFLRHDDIPPAWIIDRPDAVDAPLPLRPELPVPGPELGEVVERAAEVPEERAPVEERVVIFDV